MSERLLPIEKTSHISDPAMQRTIIKVIGVGGGGGNAVNYMYTLGIENVSFLLCNTDREHLHRCDVPDTICLGEKTTKGLGAGNDPEKAQKAAEESREEIEAALSDGTEMVFITAGMGGGTGTGAAPVIASIAKEMGILTVGIVTIPFLFEGRKKILQALAGVEKMKRNVDAILVVNNELLNKVYCGLKVTEALRKSDETLATSTRSISEMVTITTQINVDMADVKATLQNGGVSIITRGFASQEEGVAVAVERALKSPLLNTSNFDRASRLLYLITYKEGTEPKIDMTETMKDITAQLNNFDFIWGYGEHPGDKMEGDIGFTLLASGFKSLDEVMGLDTYNMKELQSTIEKENKLIGEYYTKYDEDAGVGAYETIIFSDDLLTNHQFITLVNSTPTLLRKEDTLQKIKEYSPRTVEQSPKHIINTKEKERDSGLPKSTPSSFASSARPAPSAMTEDYTAREEENMDGLIHFGES